jgi:putative transcriptional regulator
MKGRNIVINTKSGSAALPNEDAQAMKEANFARMKRIPKVQLVRRALDLTQEEFAERFCIPVGTLRDWEQGRKEPDQAAQAYLRVIATDPGAVQFALGALPKHVRGSVYKDPGYFGVERVWFVYREPHDTAYLGSVVVPRVASEEDADALARQFAEDEPGVRFGYGSWTPVRPQTAEKEYIKHPDGHLEYLRIAAE